MTLEHLPQADADIESAADFYERERPGLAREFLAELRRTYESIRQVPDAGHPLGPRTRRRLLRRFPYGVIYTRREDVIVIVAIAHLRRKPEFWADRLP